MNLTYAQSNEIRTTIEDAVEYLCDQEMLSGTCVWTVVECLAQAKQAELEGLLQLDAANPY